MFLPSLCCSFCYFFHLSWGDFQASYCLACSPRNTAGHKLVAEGPNFLCEIVPLRRDKAGNLSAGAVAASATGLGVPRSAVHDFMRLFFFFSGLGCFAETGIFTSNGNVGFSKMPWSKVVRAECGESGAKPKAERALRRKKCFWLIMPLPLTRSNEADWSPILRTTVFSCHTTFKVASCRAGAQIFLFFIPPF